MAWGKSKKEATPVLAAAPEPPPPLEEGAIVDDYRIRKLIGDGGFGAVYLADDIQAERLAVVKLLHPHVAAHKGMVQRFINEARAIAKLKHPNIVTVFQCGTLDDGRPFIAYEYLDGGPLSRLIATTSGPMDVRKIVQIIAPTAAGLHRAHREGIVHRDIKPDNIILTQTEDNDHHPTLIDFGIAKRGDGEAGGVHTEVGQVLGTPQYMAPEQLRATSEVDARADVYSLAVITWQMATGQRLWTAKASATTPTAVFEQQLKGERPLNPCAILPSLPPRLGAVIAKGLAFDPDERWQSVQEFAIELAKAAPPSEYGAPNGETDAMDLIYRFAPSLAKVSTHANTAGRPLPEPPVGTPTVRMNPVSAAPSIGAPYLTPPPPQIARPDGVATAQHARQREAVVAAHPTQAPSPPPPHATTFSSAVGQTFTPPSMVGPPRRSRALVFGAIGSAAIGAVVVAALVAGGDGDAARPDTASPPAPTAPATVPTSVPASSALAIFTEPPGAIIFIDGTSKGTAPLNVPAAVGAELEVRAELAGHAPKVERVRVGADPATVRLGLAPIAPIVDAAVERQVDAGASRRDRPRPPRRDPPPFDPDGVVQP